MPKASTDINSLKKVIVHYPDDGIEVITPTNALTFLYDDIVYLPKMREEHNIFTDVLRKVIGKENVLDTFNLFLETLDLNIIEANEKLLKYIVEHEKLSKRKTNILKRLSNKELAYTLFTGILQSTKELLFPPLPNYIFTRDIGVVINDHILICNASRKVRTRENIITRFIIYYHPLFKDCQNDKIIDLTKESDDCTLEGGDVMMLNKDFLLVGCSERSTPEAFEVLKNKLFKNKVIKNVVRIVIPQDRSCMHIDTLFTQISETEYVIYEKTLLSDLIKVTQYSSDGKRKEYYNLKDFFLAYNENMKFILCGNGEETFAEREQWTDGCNLVALKNTVAVAYDRNEKTAEALKNAGYTIIAAADFLKKDIDPNLSKTIIKIPSTELSRARGGPHCMTFPVQRA